MKTFSNAFRLFGFAAISLSTIGSLAAQPPAAAPTPRSQDLVRVFSNEPRTYLGVGVAEVDAERSRALKLKEEYGVEITRVDEDSPAEKAGLKANDVVMEYNGQRVEGAEQFVRFVRETPPGRTVKLLVVRNGATQTITAALGSRKGSLRSFNWEMPPIEITVPDIPQATMSWRSSMLGVEAEALESQLATYFGVKEGVLVRSVTQGTAAEKAGLKAGDVLVKVDDSRVTTPREVTSIVRGARSKDRKQVPITLVRERKEMSVTVTFEDAPSEKPVPRGRAVGVRQQL